MAENLKDMPDSYWREKLTPEEYHVLRERGDSMPQYKEVKSASDPDGMFVCVACGHDLFAAKDQFESLTPGLAGWPAFTVAAAKENIELRNDDRHGMRRKEVICANCGSHLGHFFENDPYSPNGNHYCVSDLSISFKPTTTGSEA